MPANPAMPAEPGGYKGVQVLRSLLLAACLPLLLQACAQPAPRIEPTPLKPLSSVLKLSKAWAVGVGGEDKRRYSEFVPYVDEEGVYAASVDGVVSRFSADKGKRTWQRKLDLPLGSGVGGDSVNVYVASREGVVYALDKENGKTRWTHQMASQVLVRPVTGSTSQSHVADATGTLSDDTLVIVRAADGNVRALERDSGEELWSVSFDTPALTLHGYSEPVVLRSGILLGLENGRLVALSRELGQVLWESTVSYPSGRSEVERLVDIDANLLTDNNHIYAVTYQGKLARIEPQRGRITWEVALSSVAGMAQDNDHLFVSLDDSVLVAVSKDSGEIIWRQEAFKGRLLSRPAVVRGIAPDGGHAVVVADYEGYLHAVAASSGELLGRRQVGSAAVKMPVSSVADQGLGVPATEDSDTQASGAATLFLQDNESRVIAVRVK